MQPRPMFEKIIEATCKYYDITEAELFAAKLDTETVYRRKIVVTLARKNTTMSYKNIAKRVGLKAPNWVSQMVEEIECGSGIYRQMSDDLGNIISIVGNLQ